MHLDSETKGYLLGKWGRQAAAAALFYSGALTLLRLRDHGWRFLDRKRGEFYYPFIVLLYHRINPDNDPFFSAISVTTFDGQIRYLAANCRVLSLTTIIDRLKQGLGIPPRTVAVTFDDGYRDNYLYAHPILNKYNCPATVFTATNYIGTEDLMWNDKVALAIKFTTQKSVTIPSLPDAILLETHRDKIIALERILQALKAVPESDKVTVVEEICKRLYNKRSPRIGPLMLSWNELRQMAKQGWEVGSHTANHVILTRVPFCRAQEEIRLSGSMLERNLDRPIRLFAYPNGKPGDFDLSIKEVLREAGYLGALTTVDRSNPQDVDLFEIGRKSPWEESIPGFALRLSRTFWRQP